MLAEKNDIIESWTVKFLTRWLACWDVPPLRNVFLPMPRRMLTPAVLKVVAASHCTFAAALLHLRPETAHELLMDGDGDLFAWEYDVARIVTGLWHGNRDVYDATTSCELLDRLLTLRPVRDGSVKFLHDLRRCEVHDIVAHAWPDVKARVAAGHALRRAGLLFCGWEELDSPAAAADVLAATMGALAAAAPSFEAHADAVRATMVSHLSGGLARCAARGVPVPDVLRA